MYLASVMWTLANTSGGSWNIQRGGNTIFTLAGQSGYFDFWGENFRLEVGGDPQSNVIFTLANSPGSIVLKLHKNSGA